MCHNDVGGILVEDGILAKDLRVEDTYGTYFTFGPADEVPNGTFKTVGVDVLEVAFQSALGLRPTGEEKEANRVRLMFTAMTTGAIKPEDAINSAETLYLQRSTTATHAGGTFFHYRHAFLPSTRFLSLSTRFLSLSTRCILFCSLIRKLSY